MPIVVFDVGRLLWDQSDIPGAPQPPFLFDLSTEGEACCLLVLSRIASGFYRVPDFLELFEYGLAEQYEANLFDVGVVGELFDADG